MITCHLLLTFFFYRRLVSYYDYYIKITSYETPRRTKTDIRVEFDIFTASIFVSNNGIGKHKYENVIKLVKVLARLLTGLKF